MKKAKSDRSMLLRETPVEGLVLAKLPVTKLIVCLDMTDDFHLPTFASSLQMVSVGCLLVN